MPERKKHRMIGGGERTISGVTGRHLLASMAPTSWTSPYWTQKERDAFVAGGRRPAQPTLFDPTLGHSLEALNTQEHSNGDEA